MMKSSLRSIRSTNPWGRWICSSCRLQISQVSRFAAVPRQSRQRWLSTGKPAFFLQGTSTIPVDHATTNARHDDFILRDIFDSPGQFKQWKRESRASQSGEKTVGLFNNAYLAHPDGFLHFAQVSLSRARSLVDQVLKSESREDYRVIVRRLDRLSDTLCRVLDMADFVRVTHPQPGIQRSANEAWDLVYQYMNELNTTTGLHEQLTKAMADPEVTKMWTEEEMAVATVLELDFSKSAVNFGKEHRDRFVALSSEISTVASRFVQEMAPEVPRLVFPSSQVRGMDPTEARSVTHHGKTYLMTLSAQASIALRSVHGPDTRKLLYYASRTASSHSVKLLEYLMRLRSELAHLSGFDSYGHLALRDRMMAGSPEAVEKFLQALAKSTNPKAKTEVDDLVQEKRKTLPSEPLYPWDKDYYSEAIRRSMITATRDGDLSSYFSLGVVMQGLSRLFNRLYGIRLVPRCPLPGETWHSDVRRLDVISDTDGLVAVLYCDLFYRPGKSPNPAHFTVRCSREIFPDEVSEAWEQSQREQKRQNGDMPTFESPEFAANDGMAFSKQLGGTGTIKQLPTIALVCDFQHTAASVNSPALLSFHQLETLFHEMGHAIHSILARTSFQNVSGTRCATDMAELPSTLMEYFAADPSVLAEFARHYETDEPLPYKLVTEKLRLANRFEASDTENQIILAMLDQKLHSPLASQQDFDSTAIYSGLQHQYSSSPPDPYGTRWQGFFGHLSGYGSTYYSYLFDRVLAQRVWDVVFASGKNGAALQRENGERLKENLLKWGGGRDPWRCMADTLGEQRLANGGEEAMALVGSWGAGSH
ncbi:hypothetical protein QBC35DRAFT_496600 [Podospora australis]|uniref:Mitochondrial intermediate peptidase n=1 Tax=Podospora australis TaxID=1536484 RepID=A0AAN6WUE5_9PEZI|nr:hypothetical protein QBC35DRAFT_496600 [Podospora australis]